MASELGPELLSSKTRLRIADLISIRPRTLEELSDLSNVSAQGVMKHLRALKSLGLVDVRKPQVKGLKVHKLYSLKSSSVGDFSTSKTMIVNVSGPERPSRERSKRNADLELMAEDAIIQRRRIREQARRLDRLIDELGSSEADLKAALGDLRLGNEDKVILDVFYTEDSMEESERILSRYYGLKDGRRSIERALANANRNARKGKIGDGDKR